MAKVPSVIFVLPVKGSSGGANSVVQEALGLSELGVRCVVAVDAKNWGSFIDNYPELMGKAVALRSYDSPKALAELMKDCDVAIATTNVSVTEVSTALETLSPQERAALKLAYYVQDYEPLFYHPESEGWRIAHASYGALKDATFFAKTKWLCDIVYLNHGIKVRKVTPSIDHGIYYPDLSLEKDYICVGAMLRVRTARRAPQRTARILQILRDTVPQKIMFQVFGSSSEELESAGIATSDGILNRGRLKRTEVPAFMRACDLFLDLSDFQAFGRTGLEAMASGCIPLVPALGGTDEYAVHGRNALVVDTRSDRDILKAIEMFLDLPDRERRTMQQAALETAANFSIRKAALSELRLFQEMCWQNA
ncbi:glycosyltransferase family 4 protein [Mesorhizobium sp. IMUNJ 23232]|uniref:glycosyltransferase family 4 protein n=1 Tax=Mesorhizobium sp. IMUNJ 23232 TaxID=3376064 RepID=UPI00378D52B4